MNKNIIVAFCNMAWGPHYSNLIWPPDMDLLELGLLETATFKMEIDKDEERRD